MYSTKYNLWQILQILISDMFRQRGAILRKSFRSKEYERNTPVYVSFALTGMIKILK
jgi:hypothetical protein